MSIALDTNVLARFLLRDNEQEYAQAVRLIAEATQTEGIYLSAFVFVELMWVLRSAGVRRAEALEKLERLMHMPGVMVGMRELLLAAMSECKKGKADFADYVMYHDSMQHKARLFASFDKGLCREKIHAMAPNAIEV